MFLSPRGDIFVRSYQENEGQAAALANGIDVVLQSEQDDICGNCGHVVYPVTDGHGGVLNGVVLFEFREGKEYVE